MTLSTSAPTSSADGIPPAPVTVTAAGGTANSNVNVAIQSPVLNAHYVVGSIPSDELFFYMSNGEPNEPYAVFYSFSQSPSSFPGLIDFVEIHRLAHQEIGPDRLVDVFFQGSQLGIQALPPEQAPILELHQAPMDRFREACQVLLATPKPAAPVPQKRPQVPWEATIARSMCHLGREPQHELVVGPVEAPEADDSKQ